MYEQLQKVNSEINYRLRTDICPKLNIIRNNENQIIDLIKQLNDAIALRKDNGGSSITEFEINALKSFISQQKINFFDENNFLKTVGPLIDSGILDPEDKTNVLSAQHKA